MGYSQPYQTARRGPVGPVPASLQTAVRLMYGGAAYALVWAIGTIVVGNSYISHHPSIDSSGSYRLGGVVVAAIVASIIEIALWLVVARGCQRGRNGARITGTVLFGLHTLGVLGTLGAESGLGGIKVLTVIGWLIALGATVFLWQRPSTDFFRAQVSRR
jgi:hypothetical protein